MRYATEANFTGAPVPGYDAPTCWLKSEAAHKLALVADSVASQGLRLVVLDCYRPTVATQAFLRWVADEKDQATKADYYPRVAKRDLFRLGYIGAKSAHSTGYAVDVGLVRADGAALDFGGTFDLFDTRSVTTSFEVSAAARGNRARLAAFMSAKGFKNYAREWWHYFLPERSEKMFSDAVEP